MPQLTALSRDVNVRVGVGARLSLDMGREEGQGALCSFLTALVPWQEEIPLPPPR